MSLDLRHFGGILLALGLGTVGGLAFLWAEMPLPWMLGAMLFNTAAAIAGLPIRPPLKVRPVMILVLGILLGSGFSPQIFDQIGDWLVSILLLALHLALVGLTVVPYFIRFGRLDRTTAYFAGMPGGLNEMILIGSAMGGDERTIALIHASRIILVVFSVAAWFRLVEGLEMGDRASGASLLDMAGSDLLILGACGLLGWRIAGPLRLPAPMLVGPMLVSAAAHLAGLTTSQPPVELVALAQLVLGTIIGCRFLGVTPEELKRTVGLGVGTTLIMMALTALFAIAVGALAGIDPALVLLAYAPGGLAEMSLVALALGAEVGYVAVHHTIRITLVVINAPLVFRLAGRPGAARPADPRASRDNAD